MAVTKSSSRNEIREYQRQLNAAGANLVVDGIWGPKTQAAHDKFGDDVPEGGGGDALPGTGEEGGDPRFGIAGGAQLWKNSTTGESFIVYMVPGTEDDPVYMRWLVPSEEDVQSFFGPEQTVTYNETFDEDDEMWGNTVDFGSSDDILNTSKNPFDSWVSTLEVESVSQPWLLDADYQQLLAMSMIEGRPLTEGEIKTTSFWRDHTEAERNWMKLYHGDPSEAERRIADNRTRQADMFRVEGLTGFDEDLVNFFADKVTKGEWSVDKAKHELAKLSDPYFKNEAIDEDLLAYIEDNSINLGQTVDETDRVRQLVKQWLGPNFGNWDEVTISDWASRLRNEDDAELYLIETLKDQKEAMYDGYSREADYNTISGPWRSFAAMHWGVAPAENDSVLDQLIKLNDANEGAKLARQTGFERGYDKVVNEMTTSMRTGMRNNVRGAV